MEAKTESWRELGLQLRHTMILCDSLRLRMKKLETENNELLGGCKSLLGKLKARYELMKEATERKYRESLGNPEREGENKILTNIQEENIQVIFMLIFIIILFCCIFYKLHK